MKLRNKKTGKVFDVIIREKGGGGSYSFIVCDMKAYEQSKIMLNSASFILGEYNSLAELNEEWEDYKLAEPLIKDEKIRKAVRAWAEAIDCNGEVYHMTNWKCSSLIATGQKSEIKFNFELDGLEDTFYYTITELCGEEE